VPVTRFRVERVVERDTKVEKGGVLHHDVAIDVRLVVARATHRSHANDTVWNGLSDGEIWLTGVRTEMRAVFVTGREFWVDFRPSDEDPTKP
jgi:hypothetical protein